MKFRPYIVAILIIGVASLIRVAVFSDLGRGTTYLTYYPAVVLAALFGGLYAGLLATIAAALLCFYWIQQGYMSYVETLAMGAFVISCTMISGVAEAMIRAEERAKREQERAEVANKAKSTFLARMSHELRTPMNAILGFTEMLLGDARIAADQHKLLQIIARSGNHLLDLINDVLDMAKIDAGRMALETVTFDLDGMVREITELLRIRATGKDLQLALDKSSDFPRFIQADQTKLRQTIINLVGNAIKFTDRGGVTLRLRTKTGDEPEQVLLTIEVEDTGIGIAAEDQERVFEPFVQVSTIEHQKGTGLGLAVTRMFANLMGGQISVSSILGKGSTFRVEIPVRLATEAVDKGLEVPTGRVVGLMPGQPEYRILIVEDQLENWELLRQLLEPVGFQVRIAENGLEGVEVFKAWQPHFIWMDIRMPIMDGLEAARRIRALEDGRDVRIVAITASVFKEEVDSVREAGMDDLVRKPYRSQDIFDCLEKHLGVTFIFEDAPLTSVAEPSLALTPELIASLPEALRGELASALATLNAVMISEAIGNIAEQNPLLGDILSQRASQLDYAAILRAMNAGSAIH